MISRSAKLPLRTDFTRFRSRAQRLVTPHTTIYHLKSNPSARMAVIVPKKVSKLATTRNYLKRLTYDTAWPMVQGKQLDVVVVYKPLPLKKSPAVKKEIINELTQTIGNL